MHLNARRLWQGELVAALDAVVEDADFRSAVSDGTSGDLIAQVYVSTLIEPTFRTFVS